MLYKKNLRSIVRHAQFLAKEIDGIEIRTAHLYELVAARCGFKSNVAFKTFFQDLDFISIPNKEPIPLQERLSCLNNLSINERGCFILETIIDFVLHPSTNAAFNLLSQIYPGRLSKVQKPLAEVKNTYFFVFIDSKNQNFSISFPNGSHIFFFPEERAGLTAGWIEVIDQQDERDQLWFRRLESKLQHLLVGYKLVDKPLYC